MGTRQEQRSVEQIDDPEDFTHIKRLNEIFDARKNVRQMRQKSLHAMVSNQMKPADALSLYKDSVESYIMELEPIMRSSYPEIGARYWQDVDLGEAEFNPPDNISGSVISPEQPVVERFYGVQTIIDIDTIPVSWEIEQSKPRQGKTFKTHTTVYNLPREIVDSAYRQSNDFLAEIGVGVRKDPDLDGTEGGVL